MIKDTLIISPFYNRLDAGCDYAIQTCELLAKNNVVVVFLFGESKSFREILFDVVQRRRTFHLIQCHNGLIYFFPLFLIPFRRFSFISNINILLNLMFLKLFTVPYAMKYRKKVLWIFEPFNTQVYLKLFPSFLKLYDCVDYFSSVDPEVHNSIKKEEEKLIRTVDLMVVNSNTLYELYHDIRPDIAVAPQGFADKLFKYFKRIPKAKLPFPANKPVIGYVGGINYRLDFSLLNALVKHCKDYSFVFIGPRQSFPQEDAGIGTYRKIERLFAYQNVSWIEDQPKEKIPGYIDAFNVSLIPYSVNLEFNRYCYPMKLLEYFYLGKPVVATPIQELTRLTPLVRIGSDANEFQQQIKEILNNGWPKQLQEKQRQFAINNSWEKKIEKISSHLEKRYFNESN